MQYLGGKSRIAKRLAAYLETRRKAGQVYIEPFIGSGSVFSLMSTPKLGFDIHEDLILLWQALQDGWKPPLTVSEAEWEAAKTGPPSAYRGFVGFGCSFGGRFFGTFAKNARGDDYATQSRNALLKKARGVRHPGAIIARASYLTLEPTNALVYCDPPYEKREQYSHAFNPRLFWETMRKWSSDNEVLVSSYEAPDDFESVRVFLTRATLNKGRPEQNREQVVERLFRYAGP